MDGEIDTALTAAFPGREIDRVTKTGPSWNGANETVGVVFATGDRAYCKVALDGDGTRIAREHAVIEYLDKKRKWATPDVLAVDPTATPPYLVTSHVRGETMLDRWDTVDTTPVDTGTTETPQTSQRTTLLWRIGATLAHLHEERFDSHGEIVGSATGPTPDTESGAPLALETGSWPDVLRSTLDRTRKIGTSDRLASHYDAVAACIEANRDRLSGAPAALLHGDIALPNLIVDGCETITPIDWELAHVGDPVRDLVRAEDQLLSGFDERGPERYTAALYAGYSEHAGGLPPGFDEREPVYRVVRMLGRSGFIDQWAALLDEPIDEVAARANAALERRLDAV